MGRDKKAPDSNQAAEAKKTKRRSKDKQFWIMLNPSTRETALVEAIPPREIYRIPPGWVLLPYIGTRTETTRIIKRMYWKPVLNIEFGLN
jgi:hypothetical protein